MASLIVCALLSLPNQAQTVRPPIVREEIVKTVKVELTRLPIPEDKPKVRIHGYGNGSCVAFVQAMGFDIHAGAARNWPSAARKLGYTVDHIPQVGAAIATKESSYGTNSGHVALVIAVSQIDITIKEQNYRGAYIVSTRTLALNSSLVINSWYIHKT